MKKLLSLLLSMTMVFSFAGCGGGATSSEGGNSESPVNSSEPSSEAPASSDKDSSTDPTKESDGTLVAYFSWSGNTEQMAQIIAEQTGGDLFEIEPATPYTDDYLSSYSSISHMFLKLISVLSERISFPSYSSAVRSAPQMVT